MRRKQCNTASSTWSDHHNRPIPVDSRIDMTVYKIKTKRAYMFRGDLFISYVFGDPPRWSFSSGYYWSYIFSKNDCFARYYMRRSSQ